MSTARASKLLVGSFTFQKLELFCRVVALGSVTKAAEELHVAQPAVTAQIRDLERRLGTALVYREGRRLALTQAGVQFYGWCEDILARCGELSNSLNEIAAGSAGHVTVAASMTAGTYRLSDLLTQYRQKFPKVTVALGIGTAQTATDTLRMRACDFAVLRLDPQQRVDGLTLELLWEDKLLLLGAPEQVAALGSLTKQAIAKLPFVTTPHSTIRRSLEDNLLYSAGVVNRQVVMELGHPEAIKLAVKKGIGYTFMEASAAVTDIARGELAVVATPSVDLRMPVYLAVLKDKVLSPMHTQLMDFIRQGGTG
jgi:DNA-binding transcriptional LysR family regulator